MFKKSTSVHRLLKSLQNNQCVTQYRMCEKHMKKIISTEALYIQ